jgi:hypothetical protein
VWGISSLCAKSIARFGSSEIRDEFVPSMIARAPRIDEVMRTQVADPGPTACERSAPEFAVTDTSSLHVMLNTGPPDVLRRIHVAFPQATKVQRFKLREHLLIADLESAPAASGR